MANGLLSDWMSGTGVYGSPNAIDPSTGVPYADVRSAQLGALGNIGSLLIAAGQPMTGAQRAQLLGQIGPQLSGMQTDIYNAAQRRLMQAQFAEKQAELADTQKIRDLMKDPAAFKSATGYDLGQFTGLSPSEIGSAMKQISVAKLSRDPTQAALAEAQLKKALQPEIINVGNKAYVRNAQTGKLEVVAEGEPSGGLEGKNQALLISAMKDPRVAESPEYAIAFNQVYGKKLVSAFNPKSGQMEWTYTTPPVPEGIPFPKFGATAPAAQAPQQAGAADQLTAPVVGEAAQAQATQMAGRSEVTPLIAKPAEKPTPSPGYFYIRAPGTNGPNDAGEQIAIEGGPGTIIPADIQGKLASARVFLNKYSPVIEKALNEGRFANDSYASRAAYAAGAGEMGEIGRYFETGADVIVRTMTGMGMNISEQNKYLNLYTPRWNDSEFTVKSKFKSMKNLLKEMRDLAEQGRVGSGDLDKTRQLLEENKPEIENTKSSSGKLSTSDQDLINKYAPRP